MLMPERVHSFPKWLPNYLSCFPRLEKQILRGSDLNKNVREWNQMRVGAVHELEMVDFNHQLKGKCSFVLDEIRKLEVEKGQSRIGQDNSNIRDRDAFRKTVSH
jgi:hypothetical protein